jgi:hypothetical protein
VSMDGEPAAADALMDLRDADVHRPLFAAVEPYHSRLETGEIREIPDDRFRRYRTKRARHARAIYRFV